MKRVSNSNSLQKVLDHLQLYEHPLLAFSARDNNGAVEIVIDLKNSTVPVHTYVLPIHSRDLDHPQFAWHLQRQIYDGLHDYFIEMFIRTPQDRDNPLPAKEGSMERETSEASAVSLREQIEREIRECGPIPFSRYMEICLYDPAQGYYSANAEQFGKAGDFYTSSDIHAVFGRLLARQFDEMWRALDQPAQIEIVELGPGRGFFARDVLDWSKKKFPDFFAALTYTLQESSPVLREKLRDTVSEHIAAGKAKVLAEVPHEVRVKVQARDPAKLRTKVPEERPSLAQRFSAGTPQEMIQVPEGRPVGLCRTLAPDVPLIVFANEFFDALPVEILSTDGKLHIGFENQRLSEIWLPPLAEELEFLDRYGVHPESGERIEVPKLAQKWIGQIANAIQRGLLVIVDYGYTCNQQLAGRHRGTLMAYRHHSVSPDPYLAPGEQDLTAHVNFTALAAACEQPGMRCENLLTQSQFLMGVGEKNQFNDAFEDCRLPQERAKVALQLKHLITPEGMGENFQVLMASRKLDPKRIATLSGMTFGSSSRFAVLGSQ